MDRLVPKKYRVVARGRLRRKVMVGEDQFDIGPPNPDSNGIDDESWLDEIPLPRTLAKLVTDVNNGEEWREVAMQAYGKNLRGFNRESNCHLNSEPGDPQARFQWDVKLTRRLQPQTDADDPSITANKYKKALKLIDWLWKRLEEADNVPEDLFAMVQGSDGREWYMLPEDDLQNTLFDAITGGADQARAARWERAGQARRRREQKEAEEEEEEEKEEEERRQEPMDCEAVKNQLIHLSLRSEAAAELFLSTDVINVLATDGALLCTEDSNWLSRRWFEYPSIVSKARLLRLASESSEEVEMEAEGERTVPEIVGEEFTFRFFRSIRDENRYRAVKGTIEDMVSEGESAKRGEYEGGTGVDGYEEEMSAAPTEATSPPKTAGEGEEQEEKQAEPVEVAAASVPLALPPIPNRFVLTDVRGDGNCFYYAVAQAMAPGRIREIGRSAFARSNHSKQLEIRQAAGNTMWEAWQQLPRQMREEMKQNWMVHEQQDRRQELDARLKNKTEEEREHIISQYSFDPDQEMFWKGNGVWADSLNVQMLSNGEQKVFRIFNVDDRTYQTLVSSTTPVDTNLFGAVLTIEPMYSWQGEVSPSDVVYLLFNGSHYGALVPASESAFGRPPERSEPVSVPESVPPAETPSADPAADANLETFVGRHPNLVPSMVRKNQRGRVKKTAIKSLTKKTVRRLIAPEEEETEEAEIKTSVAPLDEDVPFDPLDEMEERATSAFPPFPARTTRAQQQPTGELMQQFGQEWSWSNNEFDKPQLDERCQRQQTALNQQSQELMNLINRTPAFKKYVVTGLQPVSAVEQPQLDAVYNARRQFIAKAVEFLKTCAKDTLDTTMMQELRTWPGLPDELKPAGSAFTFPTIPVKGGARQQFLETAKKLLGGAVAPASASPEDAFWDQYASMFTGVLAPRWSSPDVVTTLVSLSENSVLKKLSKQQLEEVWLDTATYLYEKERMAFVYHAAVDASWVTTPFDFNGCLMTLLCTSSTFEAMSERSLSQLMKQLAVDSLSSKRADQEVAVVQKLLTSQFDVPLDSIPIGHDLVLGTWDMNVLGLIRETRGKLHQFFRFVPAPARKEDAGVKERRERVAHSLTSLLATAEQHLMELWFLSTPNPNLSGVWEALRAMYSQLGYKYLLLSNVPHKCLHGFHKDSDVCDQLPSVPFAKVQLQGRVVKVHHGKFVADGYTNWKDYFEYYAVEL